MDYPTRTLWSLAIGAQVIREHGGDPRQLGGWERDGVARARGEDEIAAHCTSFCAELGATDRASLMAFANKAVHAPQAIGLAQVVAAMGWAAWIGWLTDEEALSVVQIAGKLAQQVYTSWDAFGGAYGAIDPSVRELWRTLPWDTDLAITLVEVKPA